MALSIGFRIFSFLPSCCSSYGASNFYPGGTFTHCSCQPSLDAHFSFLFWKRHVSPLATSPSCALRDLQAPFQRSGCSTNFPVHPFAGALPFLSTSRFIQHPFDALHRNQPHDTSRQISAKIPSLGDALRWLVRLRS